MQYTIKRGERGKFWLTIRDGEGKAIANAAVPGYDTYADAEAAVQAIAGAKRWVNMSIEYGG